MYLVTIGLQGSRCVRSRATIAVFQRVTPALRCLLYGQPFQVAGMSVRQAVGQRGHYKRVAPEILTVIVLCDPATDRAALAYVNLRRATVLTLANEE